MITFLELMDALLIFFLLMTLATLILVLMICVSFIIFAPLLLFYEWIQDKIRDRRKRSVVKPLLNSDSSIDEVH